MAILFFSYSHADEGLRDELEKQLAMLKRQNVIETWHDRRIEAGDELHSAVDEQVENADIILLLVSPDFLSSDYCYDREMTRAMERHDRGEALVIPVILRPCDWLYAPFGKLNATPPDGRPVTQCPDKDQAFLEVASAIRTAVAKRSSSTTPPRAAHVVRAQIAEIAIPRSSNLRVAKQFSERERDRFKIETFEYISKYFENSLIELAHRNDNIEGDFRRIDGNRFTASIYKNGKTVARCTVFMGGDHYLGTGIAYADGGNHPKQFIQ